MRTILPGKPRAKLQAVCTAQWEGLRLVVYISGSALVILSGPHALVQTLYHDEEGDLDAVAIDEASGKIATCSSKDVTIYKPNGKKEGVLKWSFQSSLQIEGRGINTTTLSWGSEQEILVGSNSLRLHQTTDDNALLWKRKLPKPVKIATFSYDATLIASTGAHDRLIKLWRRQSFGSDDTRFDFTYLPHPTAVTAVHWRRPHKNEHLIDNVLFSICADNKIRIWAATDPHGLQVLQLWEEIDMREAIQPRELGFLSQADERFAFIIDSMDFTYGAEQATKAAGDKNGQGNHALEHLAEVAKANPEVCVVLDNRGNMSAWGLKSVGCKARKGTNKFNITHVENVNFSFLSDIKPEEMNVQFLNFCNQRSDSPFTLLVHQFDGRITWYESKLEKLFDPSPRKQRLHARALWTGHDGSIDRIVRSDSGKALLSLTDDGEGLVWKQGHDMSDMALVRSSSLSCPEHIYGSCLLEEGDFVVDLNRQSISLWDARGSVTKQVVSQTFSLGGEPLCLFLLPHPEYSSSSSFVATITSKMEARVWKVNVPPRSNDIGGDSSATVSEFHASHLESSEDLASIIAVDQTGPLPTVSGFLDTVVKDLAVEYTTKGVLRAWTAKIDLKNNSVWWLVTWTIETNIDTPSLVSGSLNRKAAVVDSAKIGLTIWDTQNTQLEHDVAYGDSDTIECLNWAFTPDGESILAIGFPYKIVILAQMRLDYLNKGPAWAVVREIRIKELTSHPIGDSTWLSTGNLVVGAGNQLYVYDNDISLSDDMVAAVLTPFYQNRSLGIFDFVSCANHTLSVFHPQFLAQCILAGQHNHVQQIIVGLRNALKYFVVGDELDSFVSMSPVDFYTESEEMSFAARKETRSSNSDFVEDDESETVTEEFATSLIETLAKLAIPQLSNLEQLQLVDIVESVGTAEKHRRSMDVNAMRFFLFFRQGIIRKGQASYVSSSVGWREIVWAYHSASEDILVDLVSRQFHGRMLWEHARQSGMFMWMTDLNALRAQFEVIARNEYTKTDEKNPIDCSLYYLALKKKSVLVGLWRMAAWNREQSGTQKLLRNDFSEQRWKTAALKNAYALLGKRRFEYAAAFFLLAGNLQDAVNVCSHQMQDLQLAIAVARVYDGDESVVLRSLLENEVLPQAAAEGNRWLATWAFWMLGRQDMAVRVLIDPVCTLIDSPEPPSRQSKSYLSSEPALVVLYKQLREKTRQTLKGASIISPRAEWDFVMKNARLYRRMGCDLLALDLVRNWKFLPPAKEVTTNGTSGPDPHKMLRRSSSVEVDDLSGSESSTEQKTKEVRKPAPTVFKEPDTNSLLDSFGF